MADTTLNPASPTKRVSLRPNRSPRRPNGSSRLPKAREYAVMIHWRFASEKWRARWADGRAMFTTVASRTTISWATPSSASISQRRS